MNRIAIGLSVAMLCAAGMAAAQDGLQLYVAPNGNDAWSGTLPAPNAGGTDGPFATLERARDELRSRKASGGLAKGATVVVEFGTYALAKPFELTAEDSAPEGARITYMADGEARISGGRVVKGFAPVTDAAVREKLDESARGHVLQADLKAAGVTDFGPVDGGGMTVYFQDRPMTLSRWPNEGFVRIADIVEPDGHEIHGIPGSKVGKFKYEGDRPKRWVGEKDPWLHGYWFWDWSDQRQAIASINVEKSEIDLKEPYHSYGYRKGQWYYAFNMLSELDSPGEWYADRDAGILYFWPPAPIDQGDVVVSVLPTLVTLKDVARVELRGLTFEATRGTAVAVSGGPGNSVVGCTIRNTGGDGISMSGIRNRVISCDLYDLGGTGISLGGGDRATLTPSCNAALNNQIRQYGQWYRMYRPGIALQGVNLSAIHNLIHDAPHMAIQFGGNDHSIALNEIYRVCEESNDAGAIYAGRDWTQRGTQISCNYFHDITGFENKGCVGVYLDDMFCGTAITNNVFYNVTRAAFIGGGRDNLIKGNIFVDCKPAVHVDCRALNWAASTGDAWIKEGGEKGTLAGTAYNKPPYSERYPQLVGILGDEPNAPKGNVIAGNIHWRGQWDEFEEGAKPFLKVENNLLDKDPKFMDEAHHDYRLQADSPAKEIGFQAIPVGDIGLTVVHDNPGERWSEARANAWYAREPWPAGANFAPSTAINQLEMWQGETFDPQTIDRELGWAGDLGFNTMRVFLHNIPWQQDPRGFGQRIDQFLQIADKHGIRPLFVLFDDVWDPHPQPGRQRDPKPGLHNSGWVQAPGADILKDPGRYDELKGYVQGVLQRFGKDRRVLGWDLYNEPGNTNADSYGSQEPPNKPALSLELLQKVFKWAREVNPSQPLTVGVWQGDWADLDKLTPLNRFMLDNSDIVTYHFYGPLPEMQARADALKRYNRPIVCTEYMCRPTGSTFETVTPALKEQKIGAINWGLVSGKTQTIYPWDSWQKPYESEPPVWFHDVLRPDGTPYRAEEAAVIRKLTGKEGM